MVFTVEPGIYIHEVGIGISWKIMLLCKKTQLH